MRIVVVMRQVWGPLLQCCKCVQLNTPLLELQSAKKWDRSKEQHAWAVGANSGPKDKTQLPFLKNWGQREGTVHAPCTPRHQGAGNHPSHPSSLTRGHPRWWCCLVAKSRRTLCRPVDCSLPGSPVHGLSQVRILKWGATTFSRGSSRTREWTLVSCFGRQILYRWATREAQTYPYPHPI